MMNRTRLLVCEDGNEYLDRFERFLGSQFEFIQSGDFAALQAQLETCQPISGVLLDLDFRRTEVSRLIDIQGNEIVQSSKPEREQIAANQGIAILACLRAKGWLTPVVLFADIDEADQKAYLANKYAPVQIVASHVGLHELRTLFEQLGQPQTSSD